MILGSYGAALVAAGNSRDFSVIQITNAVVRLAVLVLGVQHFGLLGVIAAPIVADALTYPIIVLFARRYKAWDARHDLVFFGIKAALAALILSLNWDQLPGLLPR